MNKRIFASVMVTLVLVASLAAGAMAISVTGPVTVQPGEQVTLRIDGGNVEGVTADIATVGLEIVSFSGGLSDETSVLLLADYGGMTATYTYRVTAEAGQTVSFTLSNVIESQNMVDTPVAGAGWQANVVSGDQPSESPSATPTPTEAPSASPSTSPSQEPSGSPSTDASPSVSATVSPSAAPSGSASTQPSVQPSPTISGGTPSSGNQGGTITTPPSSGNQGGSGGTTTVVRLPKTADATTNMWIFASLTAAVGTIAIIAAKKCALGKKEAHDEQ